MGVLRVLYWDVRVGGDRRLALIERIDADVVLLLAVSAASARHWSDRWAGRYHTAAALDLVVSPQRRPHGAMIASRWPLQGVEVIDALPKPERGLVATTTHLAGPITLASWGAPNAAGEGRAAKEAAYAHMTRFVQTLGPRLVMGVDTNSWYDPPEAGVRDESPAAPSEHAFVGPDPPHGLNDVHRSLLANDPHRTRLLAELRPHGPSAATFVRRPHGTPRGIASSYAAGMSWGLDRMDRLYVTPDIKPLACVHLWHEALDAGGDHAALVADLELPHSDRSR